MIPLAELPVLRTGSPASRRKQERLYRLSVGKMHSFYFAKWQFSEVWKRAAAITAYLFGSFSFAARCVGLRFTCAESQHFSVHTKFLILNLCYPAAARARKHRFSKIYRPKQKLYRAFCEEAVQRPNRQSLGVFESAIYFPASFFQKSSLWLPAKAAFVIY